MQEIIVYRNPIEANFYSALFSGSLNGVILGIVVGFCLVILLQRMVVDRISYPSRHRASVISCLVSIIVGIFIIFYYPYMM